MVVGLKADLQKQRHLHEKDTTGQLAKGSLRTRLY